MPGNIPVSIEIDVSALAIGDQLRVSDVPLPEVWYADAETDFVVAQVAAPRIATGAEEGEEGEHGEGEAGEGEAAAEASDDAGDE